MTKSPSFKHHISPYNNRSPNKYVYHRSSSIDVTPIPLAIISNTMNSYNHRRNISSPSNDNTMKKPERQSTNESTSSNIINSYNDGNKNMSMDRQSDNKENCSSSRIESNESYSPSTYPTILHTNHMPKYVNSKNSSQTIERKLLENQQIPYLILNTSVSIKDLSTNINNKSHGITYNILSGTIDRCYLLNNQIMYRVLLSRSSSFLEVDRKLCDHIISLSSKINPYACHLHKRTGRIFKKKIPYRTCAKIIDIDNTGTSVTKNVTDKSKLCCVVCDTSTIKRPTTVNNELDSSSKKINSHQISLTCCVCGESVCNDCLKSITNQMTTSRDTKDVWYSKVINYLNNSIVPKEFIGNCCEIKNKIEKCMDHNSTLNSIKDNVELQYDGYLHFPQLHLMLDTPYVTHVDVHGLGKEDLLNGTPGLIHGVIDQQCATECAKFNIKPLGTKSKLVVSYQSSMTFNNMFQHKQKVRYLVEVYEFDELTDVTCLKHSRPTHNDVKNSTLKSNDMKNIDVWILLAKSKNSDSGCHLLNMRWKSNLDYKKWTKSGNVKSLYDTLLSKCKNNGMQAQRSGGSNGSTSLSNTDILKLVATNGAFPRKGKGVKLIREKNHWKCYYVGVRKKSTTPEGIKNVVSWKYQQPQTGGNFKLTKSLNTLYNDITSCMTIAKYNTACLAKQFEVYVSLKIQDKAVDAALRDIDVAQNNLHMQGSRKDRSTNMDDSTDVTTEKEFIDMLSFKNKFTLVAYPCGYHYDVFDKKAFSLENKICFGFDKTLNANKSEIGRGGYGNGMFVFAILDWTNSN